MVRQEKNQTQSRKLKAAYENMLVFEEERLIDKEDREQLQKQAKSTKMRSMAINYQQAQLLREKERDLQQSKFFHNQLAKLVAQEEHKLKDGTVNDNLNQISGEINHLELKEARMLESL